jgi:flagellar basal-body rod protein FlgC
MSNELTDINAISGAALRAQRERIKTIAQNIANAEASPQVPGGKPYQRQIVTFKDEYDKTTGAYLVKTNGIRKDTSDFTKKYDPANPGADAQGYVLMPNVNPLVEMMDMGDANRAYQANLGVIEATRNMVQHTISLLQ